VIAFSPDASWISPELRAWVTYYADGRYRIEPVAISDGVMPRVTPRHARFKADEIVRSWQGFAYDGPDGIGHTIRRGFRLRGDHEAVRLHPWNFVLADAPTTEEPPEYPTLVEAGPLFSEPTRLRARTRVLLGAAIYEPGSVFEAPARAASWLVSENHAEPV
jgi:hypothetical protein